MRAAIVEAFGGDPRVTDISPPAERSGCSLVNVSAAGIKPTDIMRMRGTYKPEELPYILGNEGVGRLQDGTRVYFNYTVQRSGACCETALVPDEEIWEIPEEWDEAQVIAFAIIGTGALIPLEQAEIQPGERVLVLGATGPLGQIGCMIARKLGAGAVVGAAKTPARLRKLRERGLVDDIVLLGAGDDEEALRAAAGPEGFHVVLDCVFGKPAEAAMRTVAEWSGRMMSVGSSAGRTMTLTLRDLRRKGHFGVDTGNSRPAEERRAAFYRSQQYAREEGWTVDIVPFTLDQASQAWDLQKESPGGKIVIKVGG